MILFSKIFFKILAILLNIIVGYSAGASKKVDRDSIASLLFYFVSPIVFFAIPASTTLGVIELSITCVTFTTSCLVSLVNYHVLGKVFNDPRRNILATSSGTANTGFFMLPIAASIFDGYTLSIYMMGVIGVNVYEASLGYYFCARSVTSTKESIKQVLRLPILHAFFLGCLFSFAGFTLPDFLDDFIYNIRCTYSVLGIFMIGFGLSSMTSLSMDWQFASIAFVNKFVIYPIAIAGFILLDKEMFKFYDKVHYDALRLISYAPMGTSTILFSTIVKYPPAVTAACVLLSCILALVYVPCAVMLFIENE